jgi:TolA-binding protein
MVERFRQLGWVALVGAACVHSDAERFAAVESTRALVQAGQCDEAAPGLRGVIDEAPSSEPAATALYFRAGCEEVRQRFDAARPLYRRVLEEHPRSPLVPSALFRLGVIEREAGAPEKARERYVQLVERFPSAEEIPAALNNLAVLEENLGHVDAAVRLYERLANEHRDSPLAASALFRVAVNAEKIFDFEKALATYARLAEEHPDSADLEAALFNRARLLEGLTRWREAADAYLRYAERFPESTDAPQNVVRAGRLLELVDDPTRALAAFDAFVTRFGETPSELRVVAQTERAGLLRKLGRAREAEAADAAALDAVDALTRNLERETSCAPGATADAGLAPTCGSAEGEARTRRLLESERLRGELLAGAGRVPEAEDAYRRALALFDARGLTPERNPEASDVAAQAAFALAELLDATRSARTIAGSTTVDVERAFKNYAEDTRRVVSAFEAVGRFKQPQWTLRARLRHAEALEHFADVIDALPALKSPNCAPAMFCTGGFAQSDALRDQAESLYESILDETLRTGVGGAWVEGATKGLQRIRATRAPDAGR